MSREHNEQMQRLALARRIDTARALSKELEVDVTALQNGFRVLGYTALDSDGVRRLTKRFKLTQPAGQP